MRPFDASPAALLAQATREELLKDAEEFDNDANWMSNTEHVNTNRRAAALIRAVIALGDRAPTPQDGWHGAWTVDRGLCWFQTNHESIAAETPQAALASLLEEPTS